MSKPDLSVSEELLSEESARDDDRTVRLLLHALRDLQFGQVTAIVQDGIVVQIERTEKRRLNRKSRSK